MIARRSTIFLAVLIVIIAARHAAGQSSTGLGDSSQEVQATKLPSKREFPSFSNGAFSKVAGKIGGLIDLWGQVGQLTNATKSAKGLDKSSGKSLFGGSTEIPFGGGQLPDFLKGGLPTSGGTDITEQAGNLEEVQKVFEQLEQGKQLVDTATSVLGGFGINTDPNNSAEIPATQPVESLATPSGSEDTDTIKETAEQEHPEIRDDEKSPVHQQPAVEPPPTVKSEPAPQTSQKPESNSLSSALAATIAPQDLEKSVIDEEVEKTVTKMYFEPLGINGYDQFEFEVVAAIRSTAHRDANAVNPFFSNVWRATK